MILKSFTLKNLAKKGVQKTPTSETINREKSINLFCILHHFLF